MTASVARCTATAAELSHDLGWLADDERARLAGLSVATRRADFLLGRWIAKRAIAARLQGLALGCAGAGLGSVMRWGRARLCDALGQRLAL